MTDQTITRLVEREVEALHHFFGQWYRGTVPRDAAVLATELEQRLDADFLFIPSSGVAMKAERLIDEVSSAYGARPDLVITIRNLRLRRALDNVVVATYEEWQRTGNDEAGVVATVVLSHQGGLRWLHVHETELTMGPGTPHP